MISYDVCDYESFQFWLDMLCDILFWVDTGLNFFFAFVDPETKTVITNRAAIRGNFMRSSSFYINIIACTQPFFTVIGCQSFPDYGE